MHRPILPVLRTHVRLSVHSMRHVWPHPHKHSLRVSRTQRDLHVSELGEHDRLKRNRISKIVKRLVSNFLDCALAPCCNRCLLHLLDLSRHLLRLLLFGGLYRGKFDCESTRSG